MYIKNLKKGLKFIDTAKISLIASYLRYTRIVIIGNGGSASTAEHMTCDLNSVGCNVIALTTPSTITAIGNDFGYDKVFLKQIENMSPEIIIAISVSGNSPNIVKVAEYAIKENITLIGFTGFNGGKLKEMATLNIHIPINNYEIVEDIHLTISHMIKCEIKK